MRHKGYRLTRWADDWVLTCRTRAEANTALAQATRILEKLGVTLNREKTRIVHIIKGFEFLGFKVGRGKGKFKLSRDRITSKLNRQNLYAIPTQKSLDRFKDQIRALTQRKVPLRMGESIATIPIPRLGQLLLPLSRPKAIPSTGWLDRPTAVVASHQAMAERRLQKRAPGPLVLPACRRDGSAQRRDAQRRLHAGSAAREDR